MNSPHGQAQGGALACRGAGVGLPGRAPLARVSAEFGAGRLAAIVGPNGAGKSTLLSLLSGARAPLCGEVLLAGRPVHGLDAGTLALHRALMPQESAVAFDFSVREVVELGRFPHRLAPSRDEAGIVMQAMQATGVDHLAARGIGQLSGGEKARAHLARALAQLWEPRPDGAARWLLLDEATAALDLAYQHRTMQLLRRWALVQGVGVVAVLHDLNLALRYAHDVLVLGGAAGVAWGPVREVLQPALVSRVWGMDCEPVTARDASLQYVFGAPVPDGSGVEGEKAL